MRATENFFVHLKMVTVTHDYMPWKMARYMEITEDTLNNVLYRRTLLSTDFLKLLNKLPDLTELEKTELSRLGLLAIKAATAIKKKGTREGGEQSAMNKKIARHKKTKSYQFSISINLN